jgi:hypothetical protein
MRTKTFIGFLACVALAIFFCLTPTASAASAKEEVLQVIKDMTKAIDNWDFDLQASLYWRSEEMSSFGPKKDTAFLTRGWEDNFKESDSMKALPKGAITWAFRNQEVTMLDDNAAIITTYAIVNVNPPLVKEVVTDHIRLTLVVKKVGGKWLIVHQHESFFPEE